MYSILDTQINIYSIDTGAFYKRKEKRLHWKIFKLRREKDRLKQIISDYEDKLSQMVNDDLYVFENNFAYNEQYNNIDEFKKLLKNKYSDSELLEIKKLSEKIYDYKSYKKRKTKLINQTKEDLLSLLSGAVEYNKNNNQNKYIRKLDESVLIDKNVISVFESSLTRMLDIKPNELTTDIMVIRVFYFDILKDLIYNGFEYNGEKYRFFTASAGQIRTKKTVFIKEDIWKQYEKTLMCGLTIDSINEQGGINVNKFLAYLALSNSATDEWSDFDIDKSIVINDFATEVNGDVDFIDDIDFSITRQNMDIEIEHTDGCGMILPSLSKKNFMVRAPFVKGLLTSFDYIKFIKKHNCSPVIKDIYGQEHDLIKEDIQIIFTKSQFKLHKYYSDWNEYKYYFKKYNCKAGICNLEEDKIPNATINYQMLQTLTDITDKEIQTIVKRSVSKLNNLSDSVYSMLNAFNVNEYNMNMTPFQKSLQLYPEMLSDPYCRERLKQIKKSLVKQYKSGKLNVNGKYTFILPDMYAACEQWFLGIDKPKGLLADGEVSCRLFRDNIKLDCLRSPHLYIEHPIRINKVNDEVSQWFNTDGIYISSYDLISKIVQADWDGDKLLVVSDRTIVDIAERNMKDVVPLFYNMRKASPVHLDNESIYAGMSAAYTGGGIGIISNDITKIWNSGMVNQEAKDAVKMLCCMNNFVIDYAKTLYKPEYPKEKKKIIKKYTKGKTPYFFIYAKNKTENQVEPKNNSTVNKFNDIIKSKNLNFNIFKKGVLGKFDYKILMHNPEIFIDKELIEKFDELNRQYHFKINNINDKKTDYTVEERNNKYININHIAQGIRKELGDIQEDESVVVDILVKYLYGIKKSKSKEALWFCYGDIIYNNIKNNLGDGTKVCKKCGKRFNKKKNYKYCDECSGDYYKKINYKYIVCKSCGKKIKVDSSSRKVRCDKCNTEYKKEQARIRKQRERNRKND